MRKNIDPAVLTGAVILTVLTGGLLLLPLGLPFAWTLLQRRAEIRRGEIDDAKKY